MTQPTLFDAPVSVYAAHRAELDAEGDRLDDAKGRILSRLRQGPATNVELNGICYRYGARLHELKREGHPWEKDLVSPGVWLYRLVQGCP